jgi:hypothetical protein
MPDSLLFPLSAADQSRIVPGSIEVADEFLDHTHALKVSFTVADPHNGAPEIRPLWPGRMDFRADPAHPGSRPSPQVIELTESAYDGWATLGTLRVKALDKRARVIAQDAGDLEVVPNCVWYFPVRLSQPFLFVTIADVLGSHVIDFLGNTIERTSGQYARNAVAWFLGERYGPVVFGSQRTAHPMPAVEMNATGMVTLYLVTAQVRELQDGPRTDFDALAGGRPASDPSHPVNASLPPRRVFQKLSAAMTDVRGAGGAPLPLAQAVLTNPPGAAPLVPVRFRRTWKKRHNNSRYFPTQEVMIRDAHTDQLLLASRIPHHGVVYFRRPASAPGLSPRVRITILGGMRCLAGDDDSGARALWRDKATSGELTYDLASTGPFPEVILRRPMAEEIFTEPALATRGAACTYHSLRRTIRALANNRIAGGQLNYHSLSRASIGLLRQALGDVALAIRGDGPRQIIRGADADALEDDIGTLAGSLKPVWAAFFPGGGKAYSLWQSIAGDWYETDDVTLKADHADIGGFRGRGAPGALVYLGLASALHNDPRPFRDPAHPTESEDDYAREMTQAVLGGLAPGALLQYWAEHEGFAILRHRRGTAAERKSKTLFSGHSPIFREYLLAGDTVRGIRVQDQTEAGGVDVTLQSSGRLRWYGHEPDLWIAASWDE